MFNLSSPQDKVSNFIVNNGLLVKALAGPCRTEPTIAPEVGIRRITVFGTGFYHKTEK